MQLFYRFLHPVYSAGDIFSILKNYNRMKTTPTSSLLRLFVLFSFLLIGYTANAQDQKEVKEQTYKIVDNGSVTNIQPYIDALNNSDMRNHRLRNKRYTIVFDKGVKVELFSATEISNSGLTRNVSEYPEDFDSTRQEPIFALGANNFIIEYHIATGKH